MNRRKFIKTTSIVSVAGSTLPVFSCTKKTEELSLNEILVLKSFENEHEESPTIVTNGLGELWLYSLRRLSYPEQTEMISCFYFDGKTWEEKDPVTKTKGLYETPAAACATGGKPIVAWTEITEDNWVVHVSHLGKNGFDVPHAFDVDKGHSLNPVLIAPNNNRSWIAWEHFHRGVLSIYLSRFSKGIWTDPIIIHKGDQSCFDPALVESEEGKLCVAYGFTQGFHQNIEMAIIDGDTLNIEKTIPIAIGGGHKDRVNINAKPALAFDRSGNLWISYENNRYTTRMEDGDNYTGDRCCALLSYQNGKTVEIQNQDKWLFREANDHRPSFFKDTAENLFLATHCGGNFENRTWKYRISWLDPQSGWTDPVFLVDTKIKGLLVPPTLAFDRKGSFWLATINEKTIRKNGAKEPDNIIQSRLTSLEIFRFKAPVLSGNNPNFTFVETKVEEFSADETTISPLSGHPKVKRRTKIVDNTLYTLIYGNLHEHSHSSNCWPAGTDGSLHDDYRFGMFAEGYDFFGMTDHARSTSEIHWRKNLRIAEFYNESEEFVAVPAVEWTLQSDPDLDHIQHGAGHYNIIFASQEDARKYIRNKHELYCPGTPESNISPRLWEMLSEKEIQCVTIPHHPADKVHPMDWNVTDPDYVTTVEIFQCRGNNEYPGCPRERNLSRHTPTQHLHAYIDYALKHKKYKMGFIASGDHNNMGIGLAALWVKEISRQGILEALRNRRTFATTGDKMFIDIQVNGAEMGSTITLDQVPEIAVNVQGQYPLEKVEIIRNSKVIQEYSLNSHPQDFNQIFADNNYQDEEEVLYYYIRATQTNQALAWSSPVWVEIS